MIDTYLVQDRTFECRLPGLLDFVARALRFTRHFAKIQIDPFK